MSKPTLHDFVFRADVDAQVLALRLNGKPVELSAADRKGLLEQIRAGEHVELEVEAVTYIQRATPNRNCIRFPDKATSLRAVAKSGVNTPFLTDHRQRDVLARGGTITKSKAEKSGAGEWEFRQTLHMVKPWAVEGVLDGTIDRFSIGWHPTGPIVYRHSGEEIEGWPDYWPGEELEDGTIVEWVFTAAELVETSAVNVPAVVGTTIEGFRAELSAHLGGPSPQLRGQPPHKEKSMNRLLKALGLSADAAEESALAAVEELDRNRNEATSRAEAAELELKAEREAHERSKAQLAEHEAREAAAATAKLDEAIAALYEGGQLTRGRDAKGAVQPDPYEATLREIHDKLGFDRYEAAAARISAKVPTGRQAGSADPAPRDAGALSERQAKFLAQMGMTQEQYEANLEKGGQF